MRVNDLRNWFSGSLALVVMLLSGCDHPQTETFPPQAAVAASPAYRLRAGDVLDVKFLLSPELDEEQTVQLDGHVSFQLAPDVLVAGKTVEEAQHLVEDAYSHTLRDASLSLSIKGPLQWKVYVVGEVTTPGEYISAGPAMTLTQAVARAGGLKESADPDNVVLLRRDGNVERAYGVSYTNAVNHYTATADVPLADFDVLYVPRTGVAEAGVAWRQYVMQFVPPNVIYELGATATIVP
jgi:polysaccharide biosynthesis/export protein